MRFQSRSKVYQYISGGKMYRYNLSPPESVPVHFGGELYQYIYLPCYLLLNSSNSGRGMEGTRMFCFSPLDFASKKLPGTSLFCLEASVNQPIQVKPALLSLFVLDWTQWGFLLPGCISI
jgi:hypothetical protein